jgi:hypothetical protein
MPTWAAVLLPIITGVIGVLGGLGGTWLGVSQARDQERRRVLGEAAAAFAARIGGAADAVQYAVEGGHGPSSEEFENAKHLVGEAANALAPVQLQFDDDVGAAARGARQNLHAAITALQAGDQAAARAAYEQAEGARADFHRLARTAVWQ